MLDTILVCAGTELGNFYNGQAELRLHHEDFKAGLKFAYEQGRV